MRKNFEVSINPALLIWARETAGLIPEEAAHKMKIPPEKLILWEKGTILPTVSQLRRVARVYNRPIAAFYLPEPPEVPEDPHDYRAIEAIEEREYSPALRLELRRARYRRQVALELLEELEEEPTPFKEKIAMDEDPESLSGRIRAMLALPIREQLDWKSRYDALKAWKNAVEETGVLVFQTANTAKNQVRVEEMRGLSISEICLPVILLNSADSVYGRIFTQMHEFVHLLLHNSGLCDLEDSGRFRTREQRVEIFCNHTAGTVLVPKEPLLNNDIVVRKGTQKTWTRYELSRLSSLFSVSQEVILRRLLILNRTTQDFYKATRGQLLGEYRKRKPASGSGGPQYHRLVLRNNGLAYTRLVLEAYYQDHITTSEVSDYLGAKVKHLGNIENEVIYGL